MSDVTASYGTFLDFIAFFRYLHQTFTDCVSIQYIHYDML